MTVLHAQAAARLATAQYIRARTEFGGPHV
jgi:hypothetical protein